MSKENIPLWGQCQVSLGKGGSVFGVGSLDFVGDRHGIDSKWESRDDNSKGPWGQKTKYKARTSPASAFVDEVILATPTLDGVRDAGRGTCLALRG